MMGPDGIQFIQHVIGLFEEQDLLGACRAVGLYHAGQAGERISSYRNPGGVGDAWEFFAAAHAEADPSGSFRKNPK
jgi:hypothetical protein